MPNETIETSETTAPAADAASLNPYTYMQNRELSWLNFNDRVLSEAQDPTVPLLERLRFVQIFVSNLDEFFRVRVGSLIDMVPAGDAYHDSKTGWTAEEQLQHIYSTARTLCAKKDRVYFHLEHKLRHQDIWHLSYDELTDDEQEYIEHHFQNHILPLLSPLIIDAHHPFPHLRNKKIEVGVVLKDQAGRKVFAIIPIPDSLPDVIYLPSRHNLRYISTEDVVFDYADIIFDTYAIVEKVKMSITRNADIHADDEDFEINDDFRSIMRDMLKRRKRLAPLRLELSNLVSDECYNFLKKKLRLADAQIFYVKAPMRLSYAYPIADKLNDEQKAELLYHPFVPQIPDSVNMKRKMEPQVKDHDILLSFPYESMDPFIKMVSEAADDPSVRAIAITIYRLSSKSKLVEAICRAAENGKNVTTLIELRARFDEQNNIDWSERLENAGCTVIYGTPGFKVHSKICLITRERNGEITYQTQIGTGNYNEKTATLYTDLSLLTADQAIGLDAMHFFQNMGLEKLNAKYDQLIVSPSTLKSTVLKLMDEQIAKGGEGEMFFKLNSLTDVDIIKKLKEASCAGVKIQMIIRGICCIVPGIPGVTENITVRSVVGRYLEHSRIYRFGADSDQKMYIASADFMTRNTERRVEVGAPILDPAVREKINRLVDIMLHDTSKARLLGSDKHYHQIVNAKGEPLPPFNCQQAQMDEAIKHSFQNQNVQMPASPAKTKKKTSIFSKLFHHGE